jgi:hypothetical protein
MGLLGDEAQVEACFGPFRDSTTLDARLVHGLRQTYHRFRNSMRHQMELLVDVGLMESHFILF